MQRTYKRLSLSAVNRLIKARTPGAFADGDGLYLMISKAGVASWSYRFMIAGKSREMGLGPVRDVKLARARELAYDARQLKRAGIDPVEDRRAKRQGVAVARVKTMTFQECAKAYITAKQADWKSAHNRAQWVQSLETYADPVIGKLPVASIDTALVMQVLEPIWNEKPETASRLRNRIENILDWARTSGQRSGDNPARWKGHLQNVLSSHKEVSVRHFPALPYDEIAEFMSDLRALDAIAARALEFLILTAARSGEVLKATWDEFATEGEWVIPAERMKKSKEHRVPLSDAALAIIDKMQAIRSSAYVFPGRGGGPLGHNVLGQVLQRLKRSDVTPHGFRSSFRDWVAEETSFDDKVAEMALAHAVGNVVEKSYRRGDLFAKRRALADAWARHCDGAEVVSFPVEVRSA